MISVIDASGNSLYLNDTVFIIKNFIKAHGVVSYDAVDDILLSEEQFEQVIDDIEDNTFVMKHVLKPSTNLTPSKCDYPSLGKIRRITKISENEEIFVQYLQGTTTEDYTLATIVDLVEFLGSVLLNCDINIFAYDLKSEIEQQAVIFNKSLPIDAQLSTIDDILTIYPHKVITTVLKNKNFNHVKLKNKMVFFKKISDIAQLLVKEYPHDSYESILKKVIIQIKSFNPNTAALLNGFDLEEYNKYVECLQDSCEEPFLVELNALTKYDYIAYLIYLLDKLKFQDGLVKYNSYEITKLSNSGAVDINTITNITKSVEAWFFKKESEIMTNVLR